jgi:hypothetical protein
MHSLDPRLQRMAAAATAPELGPHAPIPYPTREQHRAAERGYARATAEWVAQQQQQQSSAAGGQQKAPPPPVRQPPTMLAAMQRPDLTPQARGELLRAMAPKAPLEKRHKVIFSSDARRDPLNTPTHDFTVDVTPGVLGTRAHGFELIGYSLPQAEWTLPAAETALPWRHGWCASPGARAFWLALRGLAAEESPLQASPLFAAGADPIVLTAEQPLPANPIVDVRPDPEYPGCVRITLARRAGSVLAALAGHAAGSVVLELPDMPPVPLRREDVVEVVQPEYVDGAAPPAGEPLLGEAWEGLAPSAPTFLPARDARVVIVQAAALPAGGSALAAAAAWLQPGSALGALGRLVVRPPESAAALAGRLSAQLAALAEHRAFLERETGPGARRCPLTAARVRWAEDPYPLGPRPSPTPPHVHRFLLELEWQFGARADEVRRRVAAGRPSHADLVDADLCPLAAAGADPALQARWALPVAASLAQLDPLMHRAEPDRLVLVAARPPAFAYAYGAPRLPALADGGAADAAGYYRALQAPAAAPLFLPSGGPSAPQPAAWEIPFRVGAGGGQGAPLVRLAVPSGEYRPAQLAALVTQLARGLPALAPLRLRCEPVFMRAAAGSPAQPYGPVQPYGPHVAAALGPVRGFRLLSETGQAFGLAWDLDDPQLVEPARLGYRKLAEAGRSRYEPYEDAAALPSAAFPLADLGTGVPAPPPTLPTVLPLAHSRRAQVVQLAKPTERVLAAAAGPGEDGDVSALPALAWALATQRAALYHHLQPLRLTARVPAQALLFGPGAAPGSPEAEALAALSGNGALSAAELLALPEPDPAFPLQLPAAPGAFYDAPTIRALFALLHDPMAGAAGSLFDVLARLLGALGRAYGTGPGSPLAPPGTMDADGPYRTVLAAVAPASLPAVDALLDQVADGRQLREAVNALATLLLRLIQGPVLRGVPLHMQPPPLGNLAAVNGGVAASGLAFVLALYRTAMAQGGTATAAAPLRPPRDVLLDLAGLHARLAPPVEQPPALSALRPGRPYLAPARPQAAGTLAPERVLVLRAADGAWLFAVAPGLTGADDRVRFGPAPGDEWTVQPMAETGAGVTIAADAGAEVVVTHAAGLAPDPAQDPALIAWAPLAEGPGLRVTLPHNLAAGSVTLSWNGGAVTTTLQLADAPLTLLAKMLLIAGAYAASADMLALEEPEGAAADPYGAVPPAAGGPFPYSAAAAAGPALASPARCRLAHAAFLRTALGDVPAVVLGPELLALALRTAPVPQFDPSTGDPLPPLAPLLALARLNEHPFSADWASALPGRVRSGRLGFGEGEYAVAAAGGGGGGGSSCTMGALASPAEVDRSAPPYILIDIEINRPAVAQLADSPSSAMGELFSLSASARPDRDRQLVRSVAYAELGSDGSTVRLLDRQDDRSPVLFPTAASVGSVRFRFLKPDGSPYDFAGQKVMVALRFITQAETPNAFRAGEEPEAGVRGGGGH